MLYTRAVYLDKHCVKNCVCIIIHYYLENYIDGPALAMLPQDFEEFCHLIPQSGIRIKLKGLIRKYSFDTDGTVSQ